MIKNYKVHTKGTLLRGTNEENFQLKRERQQLPIILGQPVDNVYQFEHLENGVPAKITPTNNTVSLLVGIGFSINVLALDPSNVDDPTIVTDLIYVWKYNGNEIYVANNANGGKGTNAIRITSEQSRIGLTGEYVCEVTNKYGTTTSAAFNLEIIETTLSPLYYRNLIVNGCGEAGIDGWTADDKIVVSEFDQNTTYTNNFGSIERAITTKDAQGEYLQVQPAIPFKFTKDSNWANLERFFQDANFANGDGAFIWQNVKPNIIQNETPYNQFASFFPSIKYVDDYNKNANKNGLESSFNVSSTYFTRDELGFQKDSEPQTAQLSQIIDLSNYSSHIDGRVVGINNIVGRFFCYIGLGLDKYEYEFVTENQDIQQAIANPPLFQQALQYAVTNSPIFTLPEQIQQIAVNWYIAQGGTFSNNNFTAINGENPRYNTFIHTAESLKLKLNGSSFTKLSAAGVTRINVIPKAHNSATIKISALREGLPPIELSDIQGPTESDLLAVKEQAFLSHYLQTLFKDTLNMTENIPVYLNNRKICTVGPTSNQSNAELISSKTSQYNQDYYNLQNSSKSVLSDPGVQAFFAVGHSFNVPKKTRGLQVTVTMAHNSRAYVNTSPQSGVVTWNENVLYAEHLDEVGVNGTFYKANSPKIGVTQMKLCLYDNEYSRIPTQPTFFIPDNSIVSNRKEALQSINLDDSVEHQPSYFVTPTPSEYYKS